MPSWLAERLLETFTKILNSMRPLTISPGGVLGHSYYVWRRLQHGQEKIERFSKFFPQFGHQMRHQTGHEHRCSVGFLFDHFMILMRPHIKLDEALLIRCINHHDEPEGILGVDTPAPEKKDLNDLREYIAYEDLCSPLPESVWKELQRAYLLQHCLKNPECFPSDAREVMAGLKESYRNEALFFQGVQDFDYFYSGYESYVEGGVTDVLLDVAKNHLAILDEISSELPGFSQVVWTPKRRSFFKQFFERHSKVKIESVK